LLAEALPHEAACWHSMDPATLIETSFHLEDMPPPDQKIVETAYLHSDYNSFAKLAGGRRHSGVLSEATQGNLNRSLRYREILRPVNISGELRASFVVDGACWGCFGFFRETPGDFTEDERDFAHDLASVLGRGVRAASLPTRATGEAASRWPGLLMLDGVFQVESVTAPAPRWLEELGFHGRLGREPLPFALLRIAEWARRSGGEASVRVHGESGQWVQVLASPVSGGETPGRVAIILQSASSPSIAPLISAAYGLSARERELTGLVLQGRSTGDIAARLFISPHTVQGHLKSIFAKVGVRSRRELVARVSA